MINKFHFCFYLHNTVFILRNCRQQRVILIHRMQNLRMLFQGKYFGIQQLMLIVILMTL